MLRHIPHEYIILNIWMVYVEYWARYPCSNELMKNLIFNFDNYNVSEFSTYFHLIYINLIMYITKLHDA